MRLPRELSGEELAKLFKKYRYEITRQTGSHMRLTVYLPSEHHITISAHKNLKIGTLNGILSDIAKHLKIDKNELIKNLF